MVQRTASVLGAVLVGLGAFGAHGLKNIVSADALSVWQTAVFYGFIHVVAVLALDKRKGIKWPQRAWISGIFVFSGSLFILALTGIKWLGAITPIGGVLFIVGWVSLAVHHE